MAFRRRFRTFRRRRHNWQWARFTSNDTTVVPGGQTYTEDLLATFKNEFGFSVNFPDIVIWRIKLKISVHVTFPATIANPEAYGALVGVFVDDPGFTLKVVSTAPYMEKFMWYENMYYSEMVAGGAAVPVANGSGFIVRQFDIKAHRRMGNVEDSLLLQVAPVGLLTNLNGLSYNGSVLLKMGR